MSRRQVHISEAICIGGGLAFLAVSFLFDSAFMSTLFRVCAEFQLVCGYLLSISIRIVDAHKLWPEKEMSLKEWWHWRPARTLCTTVIDYSFVLVAVSVFLGVVYFVVD